MRFNRFSIILLLVIILVEMFYTSNLKKEIKDCRSRIVELEVNQHKFVDYKTAYDRAVFVNEQIETIGNALKGIIGVPLYSNTWYEGMTTEQVDSVLRVNPSKATSQY
jgi:hypothetical protein